MKNKIISFLLTFSPFVICSILIYKKYFGQYSEISHHSVFFIIGISFLTPPLFYYIGHSGSSYNRKTGKIFRSKDGTEMEEYETIYTDGPTMVNEHKSIAIKYALIGIIFGVLGCIYEILR